MEFEFKKQFDLSTRKLECQNTLQKHPDRIPVICEKAPNSSIETIQKTKYLCPFDMSVNQFTFIIRQKLNLAETASLFLLVGGGKSAITGNQTMSEIYETYKDKEDGFLYITYASEIIWG
jgi:GABA(A) receptor-associated protein